MLRSQDIQVFVFLTIPWFVKSVASWVLVHETECIFEYLLNHNSLTQQTWPIDRYMQRQYFSGTFWTIWGLGLSFSSFSTCPNYSRTNYVKIPVFHFFEKVKGYGKCKNGKCQLLKMNRSGYIAILIKL